MTEHETRLCELVQKISYEQLNASTRFIVLMEEQPDDFTEKIYLMSEFIKELTDIEYIKGYCDGARWILYENPMPDVAEEELDKLEKSKTK